MRENCLGRLVRQCSNLFINGVFFLALCVVPSQTLTLKTVRLIEEGFSFLSSPGRCLDRSRAQTSSPRTRVGVVCDYPVGVSASPHATRRAAPGITVVENPPHPILSLQES